MSDQYPTSGKPANVSEWSVIVRHCEAYFAEHGATSQGLGWPNGADLATRFGVMLELLADAGDRPALLDLGCGIGFLVDYMAANGVIDRVKYHGVDLSQTMIDAALARWPAHEFSCRDVITNPLPDQSIDVIVMNGVLTQRVSLSVEAMTALAESLVTVAFRAARIGIAFNAMNAHVDWQRDDLFHWPFDSLAGFLKRKVSRNYEFRANYGLYEYTCFVRREPRRPAGQAVGSW